MTRAHSLLFMFLGVPFCLLFSLFVESYTVFLGSLTWDFLGRIYGLLVSGHLERSLDGAAVF